MGKLFAQIQEAVEDERFLVTLHAKERCRLRQIAMWQVTAGLREERIVAERPRSLPNPSVVVAQILADGTEIEVVWAWLGASGRAKLVTVYFRD